MTRICSGCATTPQGWNDFVLARHKRTRFAQQALGHNSKACIMPARNTSTCPAAVPLCGTKAEVTVPSLDDWGKEWVKNSKRNVQPKLLPVNFRLTMVPTVQAN